MPFFDRPLLDALLGRGIVHDALHEDARRVDLVGIELTGGDQVLDFGHGDPPAGRRHGIEVARGLSDR